MTTDSYRKLIILTLLGLAFVPIVITSNTLVSLIIAKVFVIRFLIAVAWVLLAISFFRKKDFAHSLNWRFLKNPLFVSIFSFIVLAGISTALAANPYRSFFGTIERGEGYIHLLYMLAFLVVISLLFKKKQWLQFFKASLITGAIVSADAILFFIQTGQRAEGIFLRNPAFISAYLLFVIFGALLVLVYESRQGWRIFSYISLGLSLAGLAVSNTRGTLLGLVVAIFVTALYLVVRGSERRVKLLNREHSVRKLAIGLTIFMVLFISTFTLTLNSPVWEKIPGLNRFSNIQAQTQTIQSRFIAAKISIDSINPTNAGFDRFLLGWGPDNYNIAFNTYFDPEIQRYESRLFDRAHNKVLDVLVMQGLFGLISYAAIWFFVMKAALRASLDDEDKRKELLLRSSMIFFGVAYFVQNLALFDQISTYIPLIIFWGFSLYLLQRKKSEPRYNSIKRFSKWVAAALGLLLITSFTLHSFIPYRQMSTLTEGLRKQNPPFIVEHLDEITHPFNYAQAEMRKILVLSIADIINDPRAKPLIDEAWILLEEIVSTEPQEPRNIEALALSYQTYGENSNSPELIERAGELFRQELELVPGRQETLFLLAKNLIAQGKLEEALNVTDELLATDPGSPNADVYYSMIMFPLDWDGRYTTDKLMTDLFDEHNEALDVYVKINPQRISYYRNMHRLYLDYYYEQRDTDAFRNVLSRAIEMEDTLQLIQAGRVSSGALSESVESMEEALEQILISFDRAGWEGVSF